MKIQDKTWWVVVNQGGTGNLDINPCDKCKADFDYYTDAKEHAIECDIKWPDLAPHVAVKVRACK